MRTLSSYGDTKPEFNPGYDADVPITVPSVCRLSGHVIDFALFVISPKLVSKVRGDLNAGCCNMFMHYG